MSRIILQNILFSMGIQLDESEIDELYRELLARFNLIGASNHCEALESVWKDPYNRREMEKFIEAWLRTKRRKKHKPITGLV